MPILFRIPGLEDSKIFLNFRRLNHLSQKNPRGHFNEYLFGSLTEACLFSLLLKKRLLN